MAAGGVAESGAPEPASLVLFQPVQPFLESAGFPSRISLRKGTPVVPNMETLRGRQPRPPDPAGQLPAPEPRLHQPETVGIRRKSKDQTRRPGWGVGRGAPDVPALLRSLWGGPGKTSQGRVWTRPLRSPHPGFLFHQGKLRPGEGKRPQSWLPCPPSVPLKVTAHVQTPCQPLPSCEVRGVPFTETQPPHLANANGISTAWGHAVPGHSPCSSQWCGNGS